MCAIAGLICLKRRCRKEEHLRTVSRMCELQSHRGPDDDGVLALDQVCLGSNRLSIIDLSQAGHMPMADADENFWIVYNGETYNFQTLREELIRCGHRVSVKDRHRSRIACIQAMGRAVLRTARRDVCLRRL